ncbi:MAG TPA: hypothetical protein VFC53_03830 [Dehalococcoidia bacterium]|nr:hypothetical protein [Dehalococcoidia bacterium]
MKKSLIAAIVAAGLMVAAIPGSAFAHECFNASRSARGNAGASNSQAWLTVSIEEFYGDPELGLTQAQAAQAVQLALESGVPHTFTIFIGNHTIGEGTPAFSQFGKGADGQGIDHVFDAYGQQLVTALCTVVPAHPFCAAP